FLCSRPTEQDKDRKRGRPVGRPLLLKDVITSPLGPAIAAPVAAAIMLPECKVFVRSPPPVILVNDHFCLGRIGVGFVGVPAHVARTGNGGGCAHGGSCKQARA